MAARRLSQFGQVVKYKLAQEGLSQSDLAYALGISRGALTYYMYGDRDPPIWVIRYLSGKWRIPFLAFVEKYDVQDVQRFKERYAERKAAADERRRVFLEEKRWQK